MSETWIIITPFITAPIHHLRTAQVLGGERGAEAEEKFPPYDYISTAPLFSESIHWIEACHLASLQKSVGGIVKTTIYTHYGHFCSNALDILKI